MIFQLTILGSSSALPVYGRNPTAQVLQYYNHYFLIDCGENTQVLLRKYSINFNKILSIFISHLHGDHYLGLPGLLSTMSLLGRKNKLRIVGPPGLKEILTTQFKYSDTVLNYEIDFFELHNVDSEIVFDEYNLQVSTLPLEHRVFCKGYLFQEKSRPRKLIKHKLPEDLSNSQLKALKRGEDIKDMEGNIRFKNEELTSDAPKCRTYAYCSDTRYTERLLPYITGVDLLYHEATFLKEHTDRAAFTYHSTTLQTATLAKLANVNKLIIGHFSSRYKFLDQFLEETKTVFANADLATEGTVWQVGDAKIII